MRQRSCDEEREQRITMEILVDAHTPEVQAMGWYSSLEDRLHFSSWPGASPNVASRPCASATRSRSPGWPPKRSASTRCSSSSAGNTDPLAVPLAKLEGVAVDDQTRQVIEDWHYWVAQGYEL